MKKIDWDKYLFRASSVAHIMTGAAGLSDTQKKLLSDFEIKKTEKYVLSDKQKETKKAYEQKKEDGKITTKQEDTLNDLISKEGSVIGLTDKQKDDYDALIYKRDNLELSPGAKTFLKKLHREVTYNRRKELSSKYIDKGNQNEEESIDILSIVDDYIYENNKERVNNKWLTGEADIKPVKKKGLDVKSSWDMSTFPFPDEPLDPIYDYQNLSYIDLYNADEWETVYVLTNLSDSMLTDQLYREGFNWDNNEVPIWKKLEIINRFIYDEENWYRLIKLHECLVENQDERSIDIITGFVEIPLEKRTVRKLTVKCDKKIDLIHKMVELGRKYLKELDNIL